MTLPVGTILICLRQCCGFMSNCLPVADVPNVRIQTTLRRGAAGEEKSVNVGHFTSRIDEDGAKECHEDKVCVW